MTGIMDYIDIARQIIEERLYGIRPGDLAAVSAKISNNYHSSNKTSQRLISDELQALVYAAVRMPATYAAVRSALEKSLMYNDINIDTVIDVGAGTGAASLAAADMFAPGHLSLIEREDCMRKCGMEIFAAMQSEITVKAQWYDEDILNDNANRHADLVMSSYMINEIKLRTGRLYLTGFGIWLTRCSLSLNREQRKGLKSYHMQGNIFSPEACI